jgi:hypothetical protein
MVDCGNHIVQDFRIISVAENAFLENGLVVEMQRQAGCVISARALEGPACFYFEDVIDAVSVFVNPSADRVTRISRSGIGVDWPVAPIGEDSTERLSTAEKKHRIRHYGLLASGVPHSNLVAGSRLAASLHTTRPSLGAKTGSPAYYGISKNLRGEPGRPGQRRAGQFFRPCRPLHAGGHAAHDHRFWCHGIHCDAGNHLCRGRRRRSETLFAIGLEHLPGHRSFEHGVRGDAIMAQGGDERDGLSVAVRHFLDRRSPCGARLSPETRSGSSAVGFKKARTLGTESGPCGERRCAAVRSGDERARCPQRRAARGAQIARWHAPPVPRPVVRARTHQRPAFETFAAR